MGKEKRQPSRKIVVDILTLSLVMLSHSLRFDSFTRVSHDTHSLHSKYGETQQSKRDERRRGILKFNIFARVQNVQMLFHVCAVI